MSTANVTQNINGSTEEQTQCILQGNLSVMVDSPWDDDWSGAWDEQHVINHIVPHETPSFDDLH